MLSELWLLLMFEESIMKNIVIDVDFPHLWLNSFSHPLLQTLSGIISLLPYPVDAGVFDKLGKLERALMYASLVLKIPIVWWENGTSTFSFFCSNICCSQNRIEKKHARALTC